MASPKQSLLLSLFSEAEAKKWHYCELIYEADPAA